MSHELGGDELIHKTLAVLVSANPRQYASSPEEGDRANIVGHRLHAEEHGFVYWNVPASGISHVWINSVKTIYFVQPSDKPPYRCDVVMYKGDIAHAKHFGTKTDMRSRFPLEEVKFLYGSRRNVWELEENGGYDWNTWRGVGKYGFIFFKIRNIRALKKVHGIRDFAKALGSPNTLVLKCEKYVVVFDPFFE